MAKATLVTNFVLFDLRSPSVTPWKPLQCDNTSHSQEEDSVTSTTVTSARAGKTKNTAVAVAPTFVCANRAQKRGEFYTKLEEKSLTLEEKKLQAEARKRVLPTRAKSPKLTRRESCSDTPNTPEGGNDSAVCSWFHRHSIGNSKDVSIEALCSPKSCSKTGSATKSRVNKFREDLKASMKKIG